MCLTAHLATECPVTRVEPAKAINASDLRKAKEHYEREYQSKQKAAEKQFRANLALIDRRLEQASEEDGKAYKALYATLGFRSYRVHRTLVRIDGEFLNLAETELMIDPMETFVATQPTPQIGKRSALAAKQGSDQPLSAKEWRHTWPVVVCMITNAKQYCAFLMDTGSCGANLIPRLQTELLDIPYMAVNGVGNCKIVSRTEPLPVTMEIESIFKTSDRGGYPILLCDAVLDFGIPEFSHLSSQRTD
jgi:hypothetical protein